MPKYSYETYSDMRSESTSNNDNRKKVGYFKLKPGEKAVVRFAYVEPKEFEIVTVHEVKVKDKFRTVMCLRSASEPLDKCPLCAQGTPLKARFFVKLLHYVQDEQGNIVAVPEVANWAKKYADVLRARFMEYGDLKDNLFTVTRMGTGTDTSYDIQYANPMKYSEANGFVKDFSAFENFDLGHHSYAEKTKEEIEEFLQSGDFPVRKKAEPTTNGVVATTPAPKYDDMPSIPVRPQQAPQPAPVQQTVHFNNPDDDDTPFSRPRRTYDIQ